jgi:iron complex outermembrane receptor protein
MRPSLRHCPRALAVVAIAVCPALAVVTPLAASVPAVSLEGIVADSSGVPIANVQVIIAQLGRAALTDERGAFAFGGLPAATYHVTTQRIGYAPGHLDVTIPRDGPTVRVTIVLHTSVVEISGVQVTATPTGGDPRDVTQAVTTLSGQALSRSMGASVAQTLSSEPGVSVRFNGPAATAPVIRGLQGERVLVLQDGDRAGDLSAAAPDHGVSLDPLTAERIEVVRGPASLLYGNQALGGVVNVISNDIPSSIPASTSAFLATQAETVNPGGALAGGVTIPVGGSFAVVARGGGRHTDDFRQGGGDALANTFYRNYYGVGGFGFSSGASTGGIVYRGYKFEYGLPSADEEQAKIDGHRHEVVGRSDFSLNAGALTSLRVSGTGQWYTHAEINRETGDVNTRFNLRTQTADVVARTEFGQVAGALGVSGILKQYAALGDEALTPAANSNGFGAFVYQELPLGDTHGDIDARVPRLQLGARGDIYRIDIKPGDEKFDRFLGKRKIDQMSASVGISIPAGSSATFAVSAARAFRAPSVEELSSNAFHEAAGTFDVGNPTLKAEVNQGVDGILRVERPRVNGQIASYYSQIQNYITSDIVGDTTFDGGEGLETVPLNHISQADAKLWGFEGRLEVEVAPRIVLGALGDMVRGTFKDNGEPLPFIPAARVGGLARWDNGRTSGGVEYRHGFAQTRVPVATSDDDPSGLPTDPYDLVNVSVGMTLGRGATTSAVVLRVDNALDEKYTDATSRIRTFALNPGRNFALVYRVLF